MFLLAGHTNFFFSKSLELFALNFLLLPITVLLLALFFEATSLPISNGFIATQLIIFVNETNTITNNYLNSLFIILIFIFFIISFYFTMGLKLDEWKKFFKFLWQIIIACSSLIKKIVNIGMTRLTLESSQRAFVEKNENTKNLEPKIDFDSIKYEPVSSYDNKKVEQATINQQDEIIFDENYYKAPDIEFLSKPELSKSSTINQDELKLNSEKLIYFYKFIFLVLYLTN